MITYAERVCFRDRHLELLACVEAHVARVANSWGDELRCHELARAVLRVIPRRRIDGDEAVVVDGKCGLVEHSWLCFADGVILDVYVPGRLPAVQLVDPLVGAAYQPGARRRDVRQSIVDRLVVEMRRDDA